MRAVVLLLLLAGCTVPLAPANRPEELPARVVPIAQACRGSRLVLDDELSACACEDIERFDHGIRGGTWCGLPQSNESTEATIRVTTEREDLASGEDTSVVLTVTNPGPTTASYRAPTRFLWARFVAADGEVLPHSVFGSGRYREEAIFELAPKGTMTARIPVPGTYLRWKNEEDMERAPLAPGRYAIEVRLGGLGGEERRLLPVVVH